MEFFEKYEVSVLPSGVCVWYNWMCICIQGKCSDLDSRLLALSKDKQALKQKIDALQLNADKLNPNKKIVAKQTVRWVCCMYLHVVYSPLYMHRGGGEVINLSIYPLCICYQHQLSWFRYQKILQSKHNEMLDNDTITSNHAYFIVYAHWSHLPWWYNSWCSYTVCILIVYSK